MLERSLAKTKEKLEARFEDLLIQQAEVLIVKGKEQGYLTPDDVLDGFPDFEGTEPAQMFRVFDAFKEGRLQTLLVENRVAFDEGVKLDPYTLLPNWLQGRGEPAACALPRRWASTGPVRAANSRIDGINIVRMSSPGRRNSTSAWRTPRRLYSQS